MNSFGLFIKSFIIMGLYLPRITTDNVLSRDISSIFKTIMQWKIQSYVLNPFTQHVFSDVANIFRVALISHRYQISSTFSKKFDYYFSSQYPWYQLMILYGFIDFLILAFQLLVDNVKGKNVYENDCRINIYCNKVFYFCTKN